jgi:phosphoglycolate phosphatase-like HAD superfamily hydrolase
MNTIRKLVLFDIDGTLVLTGGAGIRAMNRACEELVGHPLALDGIPVAGRTDRIILTDVVARAGHALDDGLLERLRERYISNLREEIERPGRTQSFESLGPRGGVKAVMPGIRELLDALERREDVFLGLLTGNFEAGARIKLEHFDLWRYFRCGAYGDDAADRNELVPFALERARQCGLPDIAPDHILVVGDTPHDVACARAVGATPVGVATGGFTVEQLRESGAEIVFENLGNAEGFLKVIDESSFDSHE